jgi:S-adenosylmethionine:diacylglycerol 3-amino-3-carboxypropyl transferase
MTTAETPWAAGSLRAGPQRLLFGNMYEDAEVECAAFAPVQGRGRVFCIASAGPTAMRLAEEHKVLACDINPVQLAYAESRANGSPVRVGDAERAMNYARALMPLAGWRRGVVREFLSLSNTAEQIKYWRRHLDTWRFRVGFDALLSRTVLRRVYSPPFLAFLPERFGAALRGRMERGFARHPNSLNPFARLLLLGEIDAVLARKSEVRPADLQFVQGDAASVLEACAPGSFSGFALSNILDGAEPAYRSRLANAVRRAATGDAVVILRSFAEALSEPAANHAAEDRSLLWGQVNIGSAERL